MRLSFQRIEQHMAAHEYTQGGVALAMGIAQPNLSRLLARVRDGADIKPATAGKLARALRCDVAEIEVVTQ